MRIALVLALMLAAAAHAQVYKWTDANGRTQYGDRPPDDARKQQLQIQSHEGPVEVRDWSHVLKRKEETASAPSAGITMYSTAWCGYCKKARRYFAANKIAYTDIDIEKSADGHKRYKELGGRGVPLIVVGNQVMRGFSEDRFEALRK